MRSYSTGVPGRLQLKPNAFIAHPRVARQYLQLRLAPRQFFRAGQTQLTSTLLQSPMRHADFLGQQPDARARLRAWGVEIDFSDELIDLVSEDVLAIGRGSWRETYLGISRALGGLWANSQGVCSGLSSLPYVSLYRAGRSSGLVPSNLWSVQSSSGGLNSRGNLRDAAPIPLRSPIQP